MGIVGIDTYRMVDKDIKTHAFPLLHGNYKVTINWYSLIVVNGSKGLLKEPSNQGMEAKIKMGDFGEADPEIVKITGQKISNMQFTINFGKDIYETGVIREDGLKITMKGLMGISELEWITEEEATALEAEGDPIEAPPGDYKIQPEYRGKFLWITGSPGPGKSTSAQLLGKNHGYVYYEADCFGNCKNPYIPKDVDNPSMAQVNQRALKGEGLEKRMEICKKGNEEFMNVMNGAEFDLEGTTGIKESYTSMCEDILSERRRIGGDWAVAAVALTHGLRDHIRSILGPDLIFVILSMDEAEVRKRVTARHHGEEQASEMMEPINKLCEPIGNDEENAVGIRVTTDMTKEDVLQKIVFSGG